MTVDIETFFPSNRHLDAGLLILSIFLWSSVIYYASTQMMYLEQFGILFLGLSLAIFCLIELDTEDSSYSRFFLALMIISLVVFTAYFYINFDELMLERVGYATNLDYGMAAVAIITITYLTYRGFGLPFVGVIFAAIGYAYFGQYMPGPFFHSGFSVERLLQLMATDIEGIYGNLNRLMASWIALFLLYAGLLQAYGAFDLILRFVSKTTEYIRSGVAQSGVIASMIIGSVNGSASANTGITGSLTIPMMVRSGMRKDTAGGIESVASTGGQIIPPVMGAAAFLMASLIHGVSYVDILVASIVPAIIFYGSIFMAVHITAINQLDFEQNSRDIDTSSLDEKTNLTIGFEVLRFIIPFFVLIYLLGVLQYTVMTSALYACIAMLVTGIGFPLLRNFSRSTASSVVSDTLNGLKLGAVITAPIALIIAAINAIVDVLLATGIPSTIAVTLVQISGGVLFFAAVLGLIICILLGLGMPTSAAYLIVALLVAPSLITQFGIPDIAAHYYVLYGAILASITPPIATGVAVACGISGAGFWSTSKEAIKIGAPLYVLPLMFIYHPEVISPSITTLTLVSGAIGFFGALLMTVGFNYKFHYTYYINRLISLLMIALGGLIMLYPSNTVRISLIVISVPLIVVTVDRWNNTVHFLHRD